MQSIVNYPGSVPPAEVADSGVRVNDQTLTYSKTRPGKNPFTDVVNLTVATRCGHEKVADMIIEDGFQPEVLLPAMAAFTDIILSAADELMPGFAAKVLNHFTSSL
jgi:hypothetical protein